MKVLQRRKLGDPILRRKAKQIPLTYLKTVQFSNLVKQMIYTMRRAHGIGLAAPQIGKSLRIAVMETRPSRYRPKLKREGPVVVVNPKITKYSKERVHDWEGCLSFSGVRGRVPRAKSIVVVYYNETGKKVSKEVEGLWARIFQHEIDHLNGVVFADRMDDLRTLMTLEEFNKRLRKLK